MFNLTHGTRLLSTYLLSISLILSIFTNNALADNMHDALFSTLDEKMIIANKANARILSPTSFDKGEALYKSASERLQKGQSIEKIRKEVAKSTKHIEKAIENTKLARVSFEKSITARDDAIAAKAKEFAAKDWQKAEALFRVATKRLENGNVKKALKEADKAETAFRTAELSAIKDNYLKGARSLIEQAKQEKVDKVAPQTYTNAVNLLSQAETALNQNRYDFDQPRELARQAQYEARHAYEIAKLVTPLPKKKTNEALVLEMQEPIVRIAGALDLTPSLDGSKEDPTQEILDQITVLQKDSRELIQVKQELASLETSMSELETRAGLQSERLAIQEENRQRFQRVEKLFNPSEAQVFKQGQNIVIRLIGLSFESGKSNIESKYYGLLKKAERALSLYPKSKMLVEGHTDSFGGDDANLELSQVRAEAVRTYFINNVSGLDNRLIRSQGFGESRPIGNNETPEGRTKNRRIDILSTAQ